MRNTHTTAEGLRDSIERSGYYPPLVAEAVESALGGESPVSYVVHHEATLDVAMEVRRHVTVLVLSPTRLLVCHTDEHPANDTVPRPHAMTTTEAIQLSRIHSVAVTRVVPDPASYVPGASPAEVVFAVGWGMMARVDLEPASCDDENCEADHGYTGDVAGNDLTLRVSEAADGAESVSQVLSFADRLSAATAGGS